MLLKFYKTDKHCFIKKKGNLFNLYLEIKIMQVSLHLQKIKG